MWAHNRAKHDVMGKFLIDFFVKARELEGLPCRKPYAEEYLGVVHHP
jgi:hypothetical protein